MLWDPKLLLVFAICNGTATGSLARYRGRTFFPLFILGTFGWIVAIPWLALTKRQPDAPSAPRGAGLQSLLAAACAAAVFVANFIFTSATLPNCDYFTNISALNNFAPVSPSGKSDRPQIVTITNIKEIGRSDSDIRCTATAKLANSTDAAIDYRFFIVDGKLLREVQWK